MSEPGGRGYDAGNAFLQINPSFRGVDERIRREVARWATEHGDEYSRIFNERVRGGTGRAPLGPSDETSRRRGDESAGAFSRAFRDRLEAAMRALPKVEVDADSTPADRKLQGLRRQLEELSTKKVGVDLDEAEAKRKLAGLRRELDDLARKNPSVAVRMDTAAARAELDRLRADIHKIPDVDIKTAGAMAKIAALRAAVKDIKNPSIDISVVTGPALAAIGVISKALAGLSAGAAITPFIGGAAALLGPVLGVGAGAAGAGGVIANAQEQIKQFQTAQKAVTTARQAQGATVYTGNAKQQAAQAQAAELKVRQAQAKAKEVYATLTPQEKGFADAQDSMKNAFKSWSLALEQDVLPVASQALRIVKPLLAVIQPLVVEVTSALRPALRQIAGDVKSTGFDRFVVTLSQFVRPAIHTAVVVIQNVARAVGSFVDASGPLAGVVEHGLGTLTARLADAAKSPGLTRFFNTLAQLGPTVVGTLSSLGGLGARLLGILAPISGPVLRVINTLARALSSLLAGLGPTLTRMFAQLAPIVQQLIRMLLPPLLAFFKQIAGYIPDVASAFVEVVRAALPLLPIIATLLAGLGPLIRFLAPLTPYILAAAAAAKLMGIAMGIWEVLLPILTTETTALDEATGVLSTTLAANPIGIVVVALAALAAGLVLAWNHSATFRRIVKDALNAVKVAALAVYHWFVGPFVRFFVETLPNAFRTAWRFIVRIWGDIWRAVKTAWNATASWFVSTWHHFTGWVAGVWHSITGGVSGAWRGMINGLKSAWHDVAQWFASTWHHFGGWVSGIWRGIAGGVSKAFGSVEGFFKGVWYRVETIFAGAVNFVTQRIINPLIGLLDKVLGVFGVKIGTIPAIHVSAPNPANAGRSYGSGTGTGTGGGRNFGLGGREPGYAPGHDTRIVRVSPGEGFIVPEAVEALGRMMGTSGEGAINAINEALSPRVRAARGGQRTIGGTPHFFLGGVLGAVGHALGSVVQGIRNIAGDVAYHGLQMAERPILAVLDGLAGGSFVDKLAHGVFNRINSAIRNFIEGHAGEDMAKMGPSVGGAGVLAIFKNLMSMLHLTAQQAAGVMGNMWAESGFDPYIVQGGGHSMNPAAAGGGGYGLVQWTPGAKLIPLLHGQPPGIISEIRALGEQLAGSESSAGSALRSARTPAEAAAAFGLQYERYAGPPQAARSAEAEAIFARYAGKYDQGGWIPPGAWTVMNATRRPELMLSPEQTDRLFASGGDVNVTVNPQPQQSEYEIGRHASNAVMFQMRRRGMGR